MFPTRSDNRYLVFMVTTRTIRFTCAQNHRQETHKDKLREQIKVFVELKIFAMRRHRTRERGAKWNILNPLKNDKLL